MSKVFGQEIDPATELEAARFKKFGSRVTEYEGGVRIVSYHLNGRILVDTVEKIETPTGEAD